jgi:hypothetical protein
MTSMKESAIRGRARSAGYLVCKSRERSTHCNNHGEFQLVDDRSYVVLGDRFDASLEDISRFISRRTSA